MAHKLKNVLFISLVSDFGCSSPAVLDPGIAASFGGGESPE
jgi:hypothetical protein